MRRNFAFLVLTLLAFALASCDNKISLGDAAEQAIKQSSLTAPNSKPFHLQATIAEKGEPGSDYQAKLEEFWVSPSKWKRTIESPEFSQTLIQNGEIVFEQNKGDYYPHWLNEFVTALFNPVPMLDALKKTNSSITKPRGTENSETCGDLHSRVDRWVVCFEGSHGLLSSVFTKGYAAEFKEYKNFAGKHVARVIVNDPEPGTKLELRITELTEFPWVDEGLFAVSEPTPPKDRISTVRLDEETFRKLLLNSPEIEWPTVGEGLTTGGCAVFATADRAGQVREVWPGGCDNAGLQDPLREAVKKWRLKPTVSDGAPEQVEALLGFTFHTTLESSKALPVLTDAQVRDLATNIVEPNFPSGSAEKGAELIVRISVDETGRLTGIDNPHNLKTPVFMAAYAAVQKWHFRPYVRDGKPQYFHAELVFHMR